LSQKCEDDFDNISLALLHARSLPLLYRNVVTREQHRVDQCTENRQSVSSTGLLEKVKFRSMSL